MWRYIQTRLALVVLVLLGVSLLVFLLARLTPGDPALLLAGDFATPEQVARIRSVLGLDQPLHVQYGVYLANMLRGDLGESIYFREPAMGLVLERLPATLGLTLAALVLAVAVALPLGITSALRRDTLLDYASMFIALVGQSIAGFWLGIMLVLVFSVSLRWLPTSGAGTWQHVVLPAVTLGAAIAALLTRLVRSGLLEVLGDDYVRTARAKGLSEYAVIVHALRNTLIPLVTVVGLQLGTLLGGAVVIETVFDWPGIGSLAVGAIAARDYPLIQAVVLVVATLFVAVNLAVDLLYAYLDPRIRYG